MPRRTKSPTKKRAQPKQIRAHAEKSRPHEPSFGERLVQLERARHAEALLLAALEHVMTVGWASSDEGGMLIVRPDGSSVLPISEAVEQAAGYISASIGAIGQEIEVIEGHDPEQNRAKYRVESDNGTRRAAPQVATAKPCVDDPIAKVASKGTESPRASQKEERQDATKSA